MKNRVKLTKAGYALLYGAIAANSFLLISFALQSVLNVAPGVWNFIRYFVSLANLLISLALIFYFYFRKVEANQLSDSSGRFGTRYLRKVV